MTMTAREAFEKGTVTFNAHRRRRLQGARRYARRGKSGLRRILRQLVNGVLHGPMGDIPPTGRSVEVNYIQVLRFRDGKHVSFNLMFDRLTMLEQLGLVPTSAVAA